MVRRAQRPGARRLEAPPRARRTLDPARRRFPRWRVRGIRLIGPIAAARVIDLGPAGAGIEIPRGLPVGQPYAFTLQLKGSSHRIHGRVRWCRLVAARSPEGGGSPLYRAGLSWAPQPIAERVAGLAAGERRPRDPQSR